MSNNGTGVEYPTIELGGQQYTVRFSRAMIYRMGKAGVSFAPKVDGQNIKMDFAQVVDVLHLAIGFQGTQDELAELVYDKRGEAITVLLQAWGKAFPSPQPVKLQEPAGISPEAPKVQ